MSEFKSSSFINEDGSNGPDLVGVTTFTSPYYFVPPSGTTAQRPSGDGLAPGMLRFNTDIGRLEVWRGDHWATILGESPSLNGGARGVFAGGRVASPSPGTYVDTMDYVTISTLGNATTFGTLSAARAFIGATGSSTRGILYGGSPGPAYVTTIQYFTFASTGSGATFGSVTPAAAGLFAGGGSSTRALFGGGATPARIGAIDYVTIASEGNSVRFGDLSVARYWGISGCVSSSTRAVWGGGDAAPANQSNVIDYVTISTTGNATDFGDLTGQGRIQASCGNSTRGIWSGGYTPITNTIQYVTIASTGNAVTFGNLSTPTYAHAGCSSSTRGIFGGGYAPSFTNTIEYITILSTGNSVDFGDLTSARGYVTACSNGHGGL